jgi:acido-empty-quinoprotein group A
MNRKNVFGMLIAAALVSAPARTQAVQDYSKPDPNAWQTYHGDYSGKHFSPLKQITTENVHGLTLAWTYRLNTSTEGAIVTVSPTPNTGRSNSFGASIKSIPIVSDGVAYFTMVGNAYAVDVRTGKEIWHHVWQGRSAIGNRGMALRGDSLFLETPDNHVISLDKRTGKFLWQQSLAGPGATNFSTAAPLLIRNHLIVGVGGDSGRNNGWLDSRDPATGELQWRWYTTPKAGEPGFETWPDEKSASLGAGAPWQPPTYDPELNLLYVTTGNPTSAFNGLGREGSNLYTCSVVALNPDTGKLVWYYQISPHDTHDWDATEVPVLIDGTIDGKPRKLLATTNRNGYYFLLDRTNGKPIVVKKMLKSANGFKGVDANQVLIPDPDNAPSLGGALASPDSDGSTNYPAPSFDPETGLFYTNLSDGYSIFYLNVDKSDPTGFGARGTEYHTGVHFASLRALDYRTGETKWELKYPEDPGFYTSSYPGVLTTSGGVLFSGDPSNNFIAFDVRTGKPLWHTQLTNIVSDSPITFMMDGKQYIMVAGGDTLYAFKLQ